MNSPSLGGKRMGHLREGGSHPGPRMGMKRRWDLTEGAGCSAASVGRWGDPALGGAAAKAGAPLPFPQRPPLGALAAGWGSIGKRCLRPSHQPRSGSVQVPAEAPELARQRPSPASSLASSPASPSASNHTSQPMPPPANPHCPPRPSPVSCS